jgi:hypothetical protein
MLLQTRAEVFHSLPLFLTSEYVIGLLMLVGICVRICDSNIDFRFMSVFPQSSEEDITSVSIAGWIVNWRIDCCIRIVGQSGMLFWDWGKLRTLYTSDSDVVSTLALATSELKCISNFEMIKMDFTIIAVVSRVD